MALSDINDLPDNPAAGQSGHRQSHAKIHAGLKSVKEELETLPDTYSTITSTSRSSRSKMIPFATKAGPQFDSGVGLSDGTLMGGTARLSHVAVATVSGVRLAFTNWHSGPSNIETNTPNAITVAGSIETESAQWVPLTFNGSYTVVIAPGATVYSDIVGVEIIKGATFYTRTFVSVTTSGHKFPRCGYYVTGGLEGHNYANPAGADTTQSATTLSGLNANSRVFGPAQIIGRAVNSDVSVVGIIGDSIASGSGDNDLGYPQRSLNGNYPFAKVAFPGEPLAGWVGQTGKVRARRSALLANAEITHAIHEYGVNSLSVSTLLADIVKSWFTVFRMGVKVYQPTLTPQTTSTDTWATTTNQTRLKTEAEENRRIEFNTWLRDGAPIIGIDPASAGTANPSAVRAGEEGHPLEDWFEVADIAESARNSGKWKPGYTSDGTHPNPTGAAALSAAINSTIFGNSSI